MHRAAQNCSRFRETPDTTTAFFSPDGHCLASILWDGTVKIWDATPLPEKP
jgi:WD40 repeat protein